MCKNSDTEESLTGLKKKTSHIYVENGVQVNVDNDDIIDGFRFGDTIIPVSSKYLTWIIFEIITYFVNLFSTIIIQVSIQKHIVTNLVQKAYKY